MRIKTIFFFLAVVLIAGFLIYREASRLGSPGPVAVGRLAPDFTLKDQSGREMKLSDYRGNLVFLNFWATWCPPCVEEMPDMQILNSAFKDRKFKMITVSVDHDWETVNDFYKKHKLNLPTYLDPGRRVPSKYRLRGYPETFVIDRNGYIVKYIVGPMRWASAETLASFDAMIRDQETAQTSSR